MDRILGEEESFRSAWTEHWVRGEVLEVDRTLGEEENFRSGPDIGGGGKF